MEPKLCSKCGEVRLESHGYCRNCRIAYKRKWRKSEKGKASIKKSSDKYFHTHDYAISDWRPWTPEEDQAVLDEKLTLAELAKMLKRSIGSVAARRYSERSKLEHIKILNI